MTWTTKPPSGTQLDFTDPINNGLAGCWMFNEGSGLNVADLSGNMNNGLLSGTAITTGWNIGRNEQPCLTFDGAGYVNLGTNISLTLIDQFTISSWIKKGPVNTGGTIISLGQNGSCYGGFYLLIQYWNRMAAFVIKGIAGENVYTLECPFELSESVWNNIVVTVNGTTIKMYIDGLPIVTDISPIIILTASAPHYQLIGMACVRGGGRVFLTGSIDEIRVWNRVLSDSEILTLHDSSYSMFLDTTCPTFNCTLSIL